MPFLRRVIGGFLRQETDILPGYRTNKQSTNGDLKKSIIKDIWQNYGKLVIK